MAQHLWTEIPELEYPHFASVPVGSVEENLIWRREILEKCADDEYLQQEMLRICKEDSLLWLSGFCWLFEPRPRPQTIPFLIWPHQIPVWKEMERYIGTRDVGLETSRGEGASWMMLMLALHKWLFMPQFTAGFVSRTELAVDNPNDPDSMFWKLDWSLGNAERNRRSTLPQWMVPTFNRNQNNHTFVNLENDASIAGYAATGNVASGGRKTVFFMDELAKFPRGQDYEAMNSTFPVTDSRFLISSPFGPEGAYYDAMHADSNMIKLRLHWTDNPSRNAGLYKVQIDTNNRRSVQIVDHAFWKHMAQSNGMDCRTSRDVEMFAQQVTDNSDSNPFGYEFMLTGQFVKHDMPRSPWYDSQCRRANQTPAGIAQELDIDYGGATSRFFDINMLMRLQQSSTPPLVHGEMSIPDGAQSHKDLQRCTFETLHGGRFGLWFTSDFMGAVPPGRSYVVGVDISSGTAGVMSSNSTIEVLDRVTGTQVAEFAGPNILPEQFADYAVAVCYWFMGKNGQPAELIWEANGSSGSQFSKRIKDLGYPHVYYRMTSEESSVDKESGKMGWWSSGKTKPQLLGELQRALDRAECVIQSYYCLEECKHYIMLAADKIEHIAAVTEKDPSAASARHGDRVIALALAWWLAKEYVVGSSGSLQNSISVDTPDNCALARRIKAARESTKSKHAWVPPSQRRFGSSSIRR